MYAAIGGQPTNCTINGYFRTRIFEFPAIDFHPEGDEPHHIIHASSNLCAYISSNLIDDFVDVALRHYTIDPCLRHLADETDKKIRSQQKGRVPLFLVIEESHDLNPVEMANGECSISPEVVWEDGEPVPMLVGGREGQNFITAWSTIDGAWPELPNNQQLVNMILAGVRSGQQISGPIRKYLDESCLVTDDGRFVVMAGSGIPSVRVSTDPVLDTAAYRNRISEISSAITAMAQDIGNPHVALLLNAMYSDEHRDDSYRRLQYLRLWQSLAEAGSKHLNYQGNVREDEVRVAGDTTLKDLKVYRNEIAHWWTDTIDEKLLADLQRTINELVRRTYF